MMRSILALGVLMASSAVVGGWGAEATGQDLQGRFYSEKDHYMLGEPVLFNEEIKNNGPELFYLHAKRPGKCVDRYDFTVSGEGTSCSGEWDRECSDQESPVPPGEVTRGQWPLDHWYNFRREGTYTVSMDRHVAIRFARGTTQDLAFSSKFEIKILAPDPVRVQAILQEFEKNLQSSDPNVRHAALDVLSDTAPDFFLPVALTLSRDEDPFVVLHAAVALGRINTAETRAALADVITGREGKTKYDTIARIRAIEELGRSGDENYETLVAKYMDDKDQYVQLAAMISTAQLGKEHAVLQIERYFFSPDPIVRDNAARALRFSMAVEAIDVLINEIPDKNGGVRERVLNSLRELAAGSGPVDHGGSPEQIQKNWRSWWQSARSKYVPRALVFTCDLK